MFLDIVEDFSLLTEGNKKPLLLLFCIETISGLKLALFRLIGLNPLDFLPVLLNRSIDGASSISIRLLVDQI